jgi:exopolysaccharide biosynthesis polyprenyl glycosylphosphotransferase
MSGFPGREVWVRAMLPLLKHRLTARIAFMLVFELFALNAALAFVLYARQASWSTARFSPAITIFALSATLVSQFVLWSFGLYSRRVVYSGSKVFKRLMGAFLALSVLLFPVCYAFSLTGEAVFSVTLKFYVLLLAAFLGVVALERLLILKLFRGCYLGNVLVLGTGDCTVRVIEEAKKHHGRTLDLVGILGESSQAVGQYIAGVPVIGTLSHIQETLCDLRVRTVLVCLRAEDPQLPLDLLIESKLRGYDVYDASVFYETIAQKILLEKVDSFALMSPDGYRLGSFTRWLKELTERLLAGALLALLAVPLLVTVAIIQFFSPGPAIFRQQRVGRGGKVFTLYKFRTMCVDAETSGAAWARRNDPRVTGIGRWLRRTRVDELPQLVNILKGDMAFVGPRPERPEFVDDLRKKMPYYHYRHFVKPGLTGWAQVSFAYAASVEETREKLRYDLYYVKHVSIFFDLIIMLSTLKAVVRGAGVG